MPDRRTSRFSRLMKALEATPGGLLTLQSGREGISPATPGSFAGSSMFGFPRSDFVDGYFYTIQNASYAYMWQTQPHVRTVVGIIASNFAQVTLRLYQGPDDEREEDTTHPAVQSLRRPNDWQDDSELIEALASDFLVFDNAYLLKIRPNGTDRTTLVRIPAYSMGVRGANKLRPDGYRIIYADGTYLQLKPDDVIHWRGYNAVDPRAGWSKMETLRQELISEATRQAADIEFNRGGRVRGGIIKRPLDAPELDETGLKRLGEAFGAALRGVYKGKTPVLDEGMDWVDAGVSPKDAEAISSRQMSLAAVCHVYGIHPDTIGTFMNSGGDLAEARKQMYEDVLPPLFRRCSGVITRGLVEVEYGDTTRKFQFDITEKLEGDVQGRQKAAVIAAGAPYMLVNEVRALFGLAPIPGGDVLYIPPNVVAGGGPQPSPFTMVPGHATSGAGQEPSPQSPAATAPAPGKALTKALTPADGEAYTKAVARRSAAAERKAVYAKETARVMRRYFNRQADSMKGKAVTRFDTNRWDKELAADLLKLAKAHVQQEGDTVAARFDGTFDMAEVEHYLKAGAAAAAEGINATTQTEIEAAQKAQKADDSTVAAGVLALAASSRADQIGDSRGTSLAAFATHEAARQNPGPSGPRTKEWIWSGNANSRHGGLAGQTVTVYDTFTNGGQYPGDPALGVEETAHCGCQLDVY